MFVISIFLLVLSLKKKIINKNCCILFIYKYIVYFVKDSYYFKVIVEYVLYLLRLILLFIENVLVDYIYVV